MRRDERPAADYQRLIADQERRRTQLGRLSDLGVALTTTAGTIQVVGTGETKHDIRFGVNYTERPSVTFGAELLDQRYTEGQMPTGRGTVLAWAFKDYGTGRKYAIGATIGVVATGEDGQTLAVHWVAVGKAFRNPLESSVEVI